MTRYLKYTLPVIALFCLLLNFSNANPPLRVDNNLHSPDSLNAVIEKQLNIIVSRLISPNGDGVNDYWHIQGIDKYPENKVVVYNRWGDMVSVIENYNNSSNRWEGNNRNKKTLPEGTYYYILEITKERKTLNGWVYLVK